MTKKALQPDLDVLMYSIRIAEAGSLLSPDDCLKKAAIEKDYSPRRYLEQLRLHYAQQSKVDAHWCHSVHGDAKTVLTAFMQACQRAARSKRSAQK